MSMNKSRNQDIFYGCKTNLVDPYSPKQVYLFVDWANADREAKKCHNPVFFYERPNTIDSQRSSGATTSSGGAAATDEKAIQPDNKPNVSLLLFVSMPRFMIYREFVML